MCRHPSMSYRVPGSLLDTLFKDSTSAARKIHTRGIGKHTNDTFFLERHANVCQQRLPRPLSCPGPSPSLSVPLPRVTAVALSSSHFRPVRAPPLNTPLSTVVSPPLALKVCVLLTLVQCVLSSRALIFSKQALCILPGTWLGHRVLGPVS